MSPPSDACEELVVAVDTREQRPYRFPRFEVKTLAAGDYSIVGLEDRIAVERKTKSDAYSSFGRNRTRFLKELERLSQLEYAAIVIEASLPDFLRAPPFSQMNPRSAVRSVIAWSVEYGIGVFFAGDRRHGNALIHHLLTHFWRYRNRGTMARDEVWRSYRQAVLERVGDFSGLFTGVAEQKPTTDGWVTGLCPFHRDRTPSFAYNRNTGRWCCFAGCGRGSAFDFIMQTTGKSFKEALFELGDGVGVPRPFGASSSKPPIPEDLIQQWTQNLWANDDVCRWLREKRGLSDETLKKYEIGWDPKLQRYSIPIRNELVNVRLKDEAVPDEARIAQWRESRI